MTRIGFAYNQKPEAVALHLEDADASRLDEEPPSTSRDTRSRTTASPSTSDVVDPSGDERAPDAGAAVAPWANVDDEFAEWDSEETIAAVEHALAGLGEVVRLEANMEFPERLRSMQPDIVFNMAEGLRGANREAHVPAICEFFGVPYSGSDPFTLSLCLDKARTKEFLSFHHVPTAPFALVRVAEEIPALLARVTTKRTRSNARQLRLPLFVKPVHEGSSKGITERNYCRTTEELEAQTAFLLKRYSQSVLVEEFLPGAEFTCAVLGNGDTARVLPIIGMNFGALPEGAVPIYGYEAKWLLDRPERPLHILECPARTDQRLR